MISEASDMQVFCNEFMPPLYLDDLEEMDYHIEIGINELPIYENHEFNIEELKEDDINLIGEGIPSSLSLVKKVESGLEIVNEQYKCENLYDSPYFFIIYRIVANSLPEYGTVAPPFPLILMGYKTKNSHNVTLVLDLDETLLYASYNEISIYDHVIPYKDGHNVISKHKQYRFS